jgi:2-oxoglutarate ferredoxin oxidoreductase subunit beta
VTPTSPEGKSPENGGFPIHMAEMMAGFKGVAYSFRGSVHTHKNYNRTRKAMIVALEKQQAGHGLSFVEILSACPPGHHVKPAAGLELVGKKLMAEFPLGEFKNAERPA